MLFNQSFNQGLNVSGGGIFIGGKAPLAAGQPSPGRRLGPGAGQPGAGQPGGRRRRRRHPRRVRQRPRRPALAQQPGTVVPADRGEQHRRGQHGGLAGGGISLQDTARAHIDHNTIANNDSTATAGAAFAGRQPEPVHGAAGGHRVARATQRCSTPPSATGTTSRPTRAFSKPVLDQQHRLAQPLVLLEDRRQHRSGHLRAGAEHRSGPGAGVFRPGGAGHGWAA